MRALHATRVVFLACVCSGIITHDAVVGQPNLLSQPEIAGIDDAPTVDEILAVMNKDVEGLVDGCIKFEYDSVRTFFGEEYANRAAEELNVAIDIDPLVRGGASVRQIEKLWRYNIGSDGLFHIPYHIADTFTAQEKLMIESSVRDLGNDVGVLVFREKTDSDTHWMSFESTHSGCWAYVGFFMDTPANFPTPGAHPISIQPGGCMTRGIIQHETMHSLGFYHEQSRPDRDDFVTILWDNIPDNWIHNFNKASETQVDTRGTPYDYGSVMHYGATLQGKTTIDAHGNAIGQRNGASQSDIIHLRLLYQCATKTNTLADYTAQPCTDDCKCVVGMTGCGSNDGACHGDAVCENNQCVRGPDASPTPAPTGIPPLDPALCPAGWAWADPGQSCKSLCDGKGMACDEDIQKASHSLNTKELAYNALACENSPNPSGQSPVPSLYSYTGVAYILPLYANNAVYYPAPSTAVSTNPYCPYGSTGNSRLCKCLSLSSPTSGPTSSPTEAPTPAPTTSAPTSTPTGAPTPAPTSAPTGAPTTLSPTPAPTSAPTPAPTSAPTPAPTTPAPTVATTPAPPLDPALCPAGWAWAAPGRSCDFFCAGKGMVCDEDIQQTSHSINNNDLAYNTLACENSPNPSGQSPVPNLWPYTGVPHILPLYAYNAVYYPDPSTSVNTANPYCPYQSAGNYRLCKCSDPPTPAPTTPAPTEAPTPAPTTSAPTEAPTPAPTPAPTTPAPTVPPTPVPPLDPALCPAGWAWAAKGQSCDFFCADKGMVCDEATQKTSHSINNNDLAYNALACENSPNPTAQSPLPGLWPYTGALYVLPLYANEAVYYPDPSTSVNTAFPYCPYRYVGHNRLCKCSDP